MHNASLQKQEEAKKQQLEYQRKEKLIEQARLAYAKQKAASAPAVETAAGRKKRERERERNMVMLTRFHSGCWESWLRPWEIPYTAWSCREELKYTIIYTLPHARLDRTCLSRFVVVLIILARIQVEEPVYLMYESDSRLIVLNVGVCVRTDVGLLWSKMRNNGDGHCSFFYSLAFVWGDLSCFSLFLLHPTNHVDDWRRGCKLG